MKYLEVGTIVSTHGIKGEVKIKTETSFIESRFQAGGTLFLEENNKYIPIKIDSYRLHKNMVLITFNNYQNINDVLTFVGKKVYVNKENLPQLEEDDFYYDDLIGLEVFLDSDEKVGIVKDIMEVPQGNILVILKDNKKEALVPLVKEYVKDINLKDNKIIITPIEGLL